MNTPYNAEAKRLKEKSQSLSEKCEECQFEEGSHSKACSKRHPNELFRHLEEGKQKTVTPTSDEGWSIDK